MLQLGLCRSIVEAVERRAAGRPVTEVRLRIGALHGVQQEAMSQAFTLAALGTVAERARVEVVTVPVKTKCAACGAESQSSEPIVACLQCGGVTLATLSGDELVLESLRVAGRVGGPEKVNDPVPAF